MDGWITRSARYLTVGYRGTVLITASLLSSFTLERINCCLFPQHYCLLREMVNLFYFYNLFVRKSFNYSFYSQMVVIFFLFLSLSLYIYIYVSFSCTNTHTYIHTNTHTFTHTPSHTHTHIHTHTR